MNIFRIEYLRSKWAATFSVLAVLIAPAAVHAQYFNYAGRGDLMAGFRKPGVANYELVVNLGVITNFLAQPAGSTIPITSFSSNQLSAAAGNLNNLQWSVFSTFTGPPNSTWSGYQVNTIWFTLPRGDVATQTTPPARRSGPSQSPVLSLINSVGSGAHTISQQLVTTNDNNNLALVREPSGNAYSLSVFIGDPTDATVGDFGGNMPLTVENTTPSSFTSAVRSDLYQSVPNNYMDPNSGTTGGAAYYVGHFTLNPNGTMTFTRASSGVVGPPPAPQIMTITRVGNTSTIFFTTTNGTFNYSLRYTNLAGLTAPIANWPASVSSVIGDGGTKQLSDTTTTSDRIYRISVQ